MTLVGLPGRVPSTASVIVVHGWVSGRSRGALASTSFPDNAFLTVVISVLIGLFVEQRLHALADAERARVARAGSRRATRPHPTSSAACRRRWAATCWRWRWRTITSASTPRWAAISILLRLRDALAELGPARGRQVHRSWWVAEGAIAWSERNAGRPCWSAQRPAVPVSKTFRDQVKEAGWL